MEGVLSTRLQGSVVLEGVHQTDEMPRRLKQTAFGKFNLLPFSEFYYCVSEQLPWAVSSEDSKREKNYLKLLSWFARGLLACASFGLLGYD